MLVKDIIDKLSYEVVNSGDRMDATVSTVACCDLLSVAMGNIQADSAWVTVMSNINTLAVASLCDAACVVLAYDTQVAEDFTAKAAETGITVFRTDKPVFDSALEIYKLMEAEG